MEHGARTRLMTALVVAVVFGAGVLVGAAAEGTIASAAPTEAVTNDDGDTPREERRRRTPMYEQVGPSAEQSARIDSIMVEHRARMDALHTEFRSAYDPRYRALVVEAREAIKGVFGDEQADAYQRLLDEWDARRAERDRKDDRD